MSFQSLHFVLFLLTLATVSYFLREHFSARKNILLAASYYFYMAWDWRFALLLVWVTLVAYVAARAIERASQPAARRVLTLAIGLLLVTLGVFKYLGFFVQSAEAFLHALGVNANLPMLSIVLPVGISFYTFQALSYLIDVYRKQERASDDLRDFALYMGFFGTVLSGPITRAHQFLPQLRNAHHYRDADPFEGLALILRGTAKKVLFADNIATHIVEPAFAAPDTLSGSFLLLALFAYTIQIYMDLSGYTDIVRGAAQLVGFRLPENFRRPYLAATVSNFWQRWHISMSSFFRDYLFFAVGGSRSGNVYRNLLITFIAIGLWHGGGWNFVVYGAIHGGVVCIERVLRNRRARLGIAEPTEWSARWGLAVMITFSIVVLSRVLFRAGDFDAAHSYMSAMIFGTAREFPLSALGAAALVISTLLHFVPTHWWPAALAQARRIPTVVAGAGLAGFLLVLLAFSDSRAPFVYFQF